MRGKHAGTLHRLGLMIGCGIILQLVLMCLLNVQTTISQQRHGVSTGGVKQFLPQGKLLTEEILLKVKYDTLHFHPRIDRNISDLLNRTSRAIGYDSTPFGPLKRCPGWDDSICTYDYDFYDRNDNSTSTTTTLSILQDAMGVTELSESDKAQLPDWHDEILKTIGPEPVILGLDRCVAYRQRTPRHQRLVGPQGMFSTGTSLVWQLLEANCQIRPKKRHIEILGQVPWGKHNPAVARLHHVTSLQKRAIKFLNQSAVLPVVTVRHPLTWMKALCQHPYTLHWNHDPKLCDQTLQLDQPVVANLGAGASGIIPNYLYYDSLAHVWKEYYGGFLNTTQNFPLLVVRLEDLVFRPKPVVSKICDCVGGKLVLAPSPKSTSSFVYQHESANQGDGHGSSRSDLVSAFIRYGTPPWHNFSSKWTTIDRVVIQEVLDEDGGGFELMKAFGYHLFGE